MWILQNYQIIQNSQAKAEERRDINHEDEKHRSTGGRELRVNIISKRRKKRKRREKRKQQENSKRRDPSIQCRCSPVSQLLSDIRSLHKPNGINTRRLNEKSMNWNEKDKRLIIHTLKSINIKKKWKKKNKRYHIYVCRPCKHPAQHSIANQG